MTEQKTQTLQCISPVDGSVYVERELHTIHDIGTALDKAKEAQASWRKVPLAEKQAIMLKALEYFLNNAEDIAEEIAWMMGRPAHQAIFEIKGALKERVEYMTKIAPEALAPITPAPRDGFTRYIKREALGVIAVIAPWNYPYITAVNSIVPGLLAGNAVILKHSHQTPLVAERYAEAFTYAGLPEGIFQYLHLSHTDAEILLADARTDHVVFTGSVKGGHAVQNAISEKFIAAGLELGGKDPAYVRADADIKFSAENLVDGAFFNSGQSCCGIERIYVHESVYDEFVEHFAETTRNSYTLGNPLEKETNIGPMVRASATDAVREHIADAVKKGAKTLIDENTFPASKEGTPYLAPQVLIDVNHSMNAMTEETFGPLVGIMKVSSDSEAIALMNDSAYGLTASLWTSNTEEAETLADQIETGTVFVNRCDYVDPGLPWTGVKNTGRGAALSTIGFEHVTRPKSYHIRNTTP